MNRIILAVLISIVFFTPCYGQTPYKVEVLQVGNLAAFDDLYEEMVRELERNGLARGTSLQINRTVIDADAEAGLWEKVKILFRIKSAAGEIIDKRPDLVVTIGTPATKYSKDKIIKAGIPLVFTSVAIPELVGCVSKTQAGQGFTGITIYMDPTDVLRIAMLGLPNLKKIGIIHSDDDNAVAYTEESKTKASQLGLQVVSRQVKMSESPTAAAKELIDEGIGAFFVPIDSYYGIRDFGPTKEILDISFEYKVPAISSITGNIRGALLYIAPDFLVIGKLTSGHILKILKDKAKPESIPVGREENLNVIVDLEASKKLGIELPLQVLQVAKSIEDVLH
ncbi:MAG: hypothetical protein JXM72_01695 [Deltaproteobacteria bacterium]|nr:hypothetical protein [Deltaproteobacteria bacterium]